MPRRWPDGTAHAHHLLERAPLATVLRVLLGSALLLAGSTAVFAQISPGPLSRPHASLNGPTHCFECHATKGEGMSSACQSCHDDIRWLVERGRGLHGRPGTADCGSCHPEHAGVDFDLIAWEEGSREKFDHARSGWPLEGKHATLECDGCHQEKFRVSPVATMGKHIVSSRRWTGLEPACGTCHEDPHRGSLGTACATCHTQKAWRPVEGFDHAKTDFPLLGKHEKVKCDDCHRAARLQLPVDAEGRTVPLFKPLPHEECSRCHEDPHAGRLGPKCSGCHVVEDFHRVSKDTFDHSKTAFPLRGKHARVECASCHDPVRAWGRRPVFGTCDTCHRDPHAGLATIAGKKVDCAECHDVGGWRPSTFTVARHARSAYPLEGRHAATPCTACHVRNPAGVSPSVLGRAGVQLRRAHERCTDCHEDSHGGQLAGRPDRGACETCHKVDGWKPTLFGVADHRELRFPLEGRHAAIECRACHGPDRPGLKPIAASAKLGKARVAMHPPERECADCHADPHGGVFVAGGARPVEGGCASCHDAGSFGRTLVEAERHRRFTFPLEGAHLAVPCDACHKELAAPPGKTAARATLLLTAGGGGGVKRLPFDQHRSRCEDCHESPHGIQFDGRRGGSGCAACHGSDTFRPATAFDHDRDAAFQLEGGHARVACNRCHETRTGADGKNQVVYRPVPTKCESCHREKRAGAA